MNQSTRRLIRVLGVGVALLLLALTAYPGTLAGPYEETSHSLDPESSERYQRYTDEYELEIYQYEDLSPTAQELVDRTRNAEPSASGTRSYGAIVCRDFMLVCDELRSDELPDEFTYGDDLSPEEAFVIIKDGADRYLFQTGSGNWGPVASDDFSLPIRGIVVSLTMPPFALFIVLVVAFSRNVRVLAGTVSGGAVVATLGFLAPYLEMIGLVSIPTIGFSLLGGVWLAILAPFVYAHFYWVLSWVRSNGEQSDSPKSQ